MKKLLMMAAVAGMVFASCSNENEDYSAQNSDTQISFAAPVMYKATRAEISGTVYPSTLPFMVYGYKYDGGYDSWDNTAKVDWHTAATNNSTIGTEVKPLGKDANARWYPSFRATFDGVKNYMFAAYSPVELTTNSTFASGTAADNVSYGKTGLKIQNLTIADIDAAQMDIMYSNRVYDINKNSDFVVGNDHNGNETYSGINLTFKHAMANIHFRNWVDPEYTNACAALGDNMRVKLGDFKIHSIKLVSIINKGSFNEGIQTEKPYGNKAEWETADRSAVVDYTFFQKGADFDATSDCDGGTEDGALTAGGLAKFKNVNFTDIDNGTRKVPAFDKALMDITKWEGGKYGILIPQGFTANTDAAIQVEWAGTDNIYHKTVIKLQGSKTEVWEPGKKYIYNLIFKDNLIYFAPEVIDWENGNGEGTDYFPVM